MAAGYTAFMTYMLVPEIEGTSGITSQGYGYSKAIHCNYIHSLQFPDLVNKEFNVYFDDINDFNFLSISGGTGYTAHYIYVLAQLIDNGPYDSIEDVKPNPAKWKLFNVTDQILGYVSGQTISPVDITSTVFRVPIGYYQLADFYNLDYLNYPSNTSGTTTNDGILCFGDETYFIGNVTASIEAIAYTMDLAINLPLDQFNTSTNDTWNPDEDDQVYISEIGLYDENKNLVGIAKLNNPIPKDDSISRTLVFAMDF